MEKRKAPHGSQEVTNLGSIKLSKISFCKELYLDSILDFTLRKIITKFKCSDHCLEIEKGRHIKLRLEERICKLCKSDTETELHFIQDSTAYSDIRSHFFGNHSTYNWSEILQCKDKKSAFNLANFHAERSYLLHQRNKNLCFLFMLPFVV